MFKVAVFLMKNYQHFGLDTPALHKAFIHLLVFNF